MNETRTLVQFIVDLNYESLPSKVVETAKLSVLDTVGVGLFGSRTKWADVVGNLANRAACRGESALWGRDTRTAPEYAALVNGLAAHGIEMDDRRYNCHTGSIAVPAALAVGEETGIDGKRLISAVVAGYEATYRVAKAVPRQTERGIHEPGHKGIWGGVAAASKALGLDVEQTLNAFGIAGYMASGIWEFVNDPERATVKRLAGAWPAHSGVMASLMAKGGITAPSTILEGKYGYCHTFAGVEPPRIEELTKDLGRLFMILERETKPYAAWGGSHVFIEALAQFQNERGVTAEMVERVVIGGSRKLIRGHEIRQPKDIMAAQYSMPFLAAVSFFKDLRDPSVWTNETINDRRVLDLADKVNWQIDDEMEKISSQDFSYAGAKVTVKLRDGREFHTTVYHAKGSVQNPMSPQEIAGKFDALAGHVLPNERIQKVKETISSLDAVKDIRELGGLLMVK